MYVNLFSKFHILNIKVVQNSHLDSDLDLDLDQVSFCWIVCFPDAFCIQCFSLPDSLSLWASNTSLSHHHRERTNSLLAGAACVGQLTAIAKAWAASCCNFHVFIISSGAAKAQSKIFCIQGGHVKKNRISQFPVHQEFVIKYRKG